MKRTTYDRLIQFRRSAIVDDGMSEREGAFADLGEPTPARFVPGIGTERFANMENAATAPSIYYFLWCPELADLSPRDEVLDDGTSYAIKSIMWNGRTNTEVEVAVVSKFGK